jgi:predicted amidohydrolase YtcJ
MPSAIAQTALSRVLFGLASKKYTACVSSKRPRIEHVQHMTKLDMKRLAKLGGDYFAASFTFIK